MKACCLIPIWELDGLRLHNHHLAIRKTSLPCFVVELSTNGNIQVPEALLHVRGKGRFWRKENLLNLLEKQIPKEFDILVWLDSGIALPETELGPKLDLALAQATFVQPFGKCEWIGPGGGVEIRWKPFCQGGAHASQGLAWAMRRETWQKLGGLWAGDTLDSSELERAIIGQSTTSFTKNWIAQLGGHTIGYCPGVATHYWHKIAKRVEYDARETVGLKFDFNPLTELVPNIYGVNECMNAAMLQYAEQYVGQVYA